MIMSVHLFGNIQTWNCIYIRNLGKLYEKPNVMQFLYADKLKLILFMYNYMT